MLPLLLLTLAPTLTLSGGDGADSAGSSDKTSAGSTQAGHTPVSIAAAKSSHVISRPNSKSLLHSLFTSIPKTEVVRNSDPMTDSYLLEAMIEDAIEPLREESSSDYGREALVQEAYENLLIEVQGNPSINMAGLSERFIQIQAISEQWEVFESLRESNPSLFYVTMRPMGEEVHPAHIPWYEGDSKEIGIDKSVQLFASALQSEDTSMNEIALDAGQNLQKRLKIMLQLDGARKMLTALSDSTVGTGEVPLLPRYIAPTGKDLAQLHLDGISESIWELAFDFWTMDAFEDPESSIGSQGSIQYARAYQGGLATLNIDQLNSQPVQEAFVKLLKQDPKEAARVSEAIGYLRHHGDSKLVDPSVSESDIALAKQHMSILKSFLKQVQTQPSYGVSESTQKNLVKPAVADMKRFEELTLLLSTVEGEASFGENPVELAKTLMGDVSDVEKGIDELAAYREDPGFIFMVTRGWYGDPAKRPQNQTRVVYEFFRSNAPSVELDTTQLTDAERTQHNNRSDVSGSTAEIDAAYKQIALARPGGLYHLKGQLTKILEGEVKGEQAVFLLKNVLTSLRELRQKVLVMDMAASLIRKDKDNCDGPTEFSDEIDPGKQENAIAWINAAGVLTDNITPIAEGKAVQLSNAKAYKDELSTQVRQFRSQLAEVRSELKTGGLGWNWGAGDYHISTASIDDLIKRVDDLSKKLSNENLSEEDISQIRGEWNHLTSAPVVQFVYTQMEQMHRMNGWRDIAYEGIITAPLALGGAFLARSLMSLALARTGLLGTRIGRALVLTSEGLGLMHAGEAATALIGHHGAPLTEAEQEGLSYIERLGMTMGMLKFFHTALRFAGPMAARAQQGVAVRALMKQGHTRAFLLGTNEGRALITRTMTRSLFSQAAATGIRFGSSYAGFTAWDFIANNYQITRMTGEFNPGQALEQTFSADSLRSRAIMVPMFAMYGEMLRPMASRSSKKQMERYFNENPEMRAEWAELEARVTQARDEFESFLNETEGGLRADKTQLERAGTKLREVLEARQKLESKLPDGVISPEESALSKSALEFVERFEGNLGQVNKILGDGNVHGIVEYRDGQFAYPAERSAEIQGALVESGAKVRVHRNGVISVNKGTIRLVPVKAATGNGPSSGPGNGSPATTLLGDVSAAIGVPPKTTAVVQEGVSRLLSHSDAPASKPKISSEVTPEQRTIAVEMHQDNVSFHFVRDFMNPEMRAAIEVMAEQPGRAGYEAKGFKGELEYLDHSVEGLLKDKLTPAERVEFFDRADRLTKSWFGRLEMARFEAQHGKQSEWTHARQDRGPGVDARVRVLDAALATLEVRGVDFSYTVEHSKISEIDSSHINERRPENSFRDAPLKELVRVEIDVPSSRVAREVIAHLEQQGISLPRTLSPSKIGVYKVTLPSGERVLVEFRDSRMDALPGAKRAEVAEWLGARDFDVVSKDFKASTELAEHLTRDRQWNVKDLQKLFGSEWMLVREFVEKSTRGYELPEHGIVIPDANQAPYIKSINEIGPNKLGKVLARTRGNKEARENLALLLQNAIGEGPVDVTVRNFLKTATIDQILLLTGSKAQRQVVSYLLNHGHLDVLAGDPASHIGRIEKIAEAPVRDLMLAMTAQREFQVRKSNPNRVSPDGLNLLRRFGIDPQEHNSFPWNSRDTMSRAELYFRVKAEKMEFLKLFKEAAPGKAEKAEELVDRVWELIMVQDVMDTKLPFTPHGWAHTLDVVKLQRQIFADAPSLREAMVAKYGSEARALAILDAVGLLHDVGYGRLGKGESKKVHAKRSGEIFQEELAEKMKETFGLSDKEVEEIFLAIERHGSDKKVNEDGTARSDYMEADVNRPLLFAVRLADNLDASISRLRSVQTNSFFIKALRTMNELEGNPIFNRPDKGVKDGLLREVRDEFNAKFTESMSPNDAALAINLLRIMNHKSWPHFKGAEQVSRVVLRESNGELEIEFEISGSAESGKKVTERNENGPLQVDGALYQLWRAYEAAKSLAYNGKKIAFRYSQQVQNDPRDSVPAQRSGNRKRFVTSHMRPPQERRATEADTQPRNRIDMTEALAPERVSQWVEQFEQRFGVPPEEIWVVGSHAEGEATPQSDIDIAFVHPRFGQEGTWHGADKGTGDGLALTKALNPQVPWEALHNPGRQNVAFPDYGHLGTDIPKAGFVDIFFLGSRDFYTPYSREPLPAMMLYSRTEGSATANVGH